MSISNVKFIQYLYDLVTLILPFDLLLKHFNLGHNFQTRRDGVFILHMCIPCDKFFNVVPYFLPCDLDLEV